MDIKSTLAEAIRTRKPISYEYNKPGKTPGRRVGNPYAIYNAHTASGQINTNAHIVQTAGVSDSTDRQPLPSFRTHSVVSLSNVKILRDEPPFVANHPDYNPSSPMYSDVVEKA